MLLTDIGLLSVQDLTDYESNLQSVCTTLSVDISRKLAILVRDDMGPKIQRLAMRSSNTFWNPSFISAQFQYTDSTTTAFRNQQIVWTDELRAWAICEVIQSVYRDVWYRKANDKYEEKMAYYKELADDREQNYYTNGIGMVYTPIPQPLTPVVGSVGGGALPDRVYNLQISWVDASGDITIAFNNESAVCPIVSGASVADSNLLTISISALYHPNNQVLTAGQTPIMFGKATGWNVYACNAASVNGVVPTPTLQNVNPIPVGQTLWTEPVGGLTTTGPAVGQYNSASGWGTGAGVGQPPDIYRSVGNTQKRG